VYCGQKKSFRKETGTSDRRRRIQVSVTSNGKNVAERETETAAIP
jgi:DNA-binding MarR family transcriptional regulator